jgi:Uma2 family endonuclease
VLLFLYRTLWAFVRERNLGTVLAAPLRVRIRPKKYREPDILFMRHEHAHLRGEQFWQGADLVMEIVSPDDPDRDYVKKRADYARLGVAEYWIFDPLRQLITALVLSDKTYTVLGELTPGVWAASKLLDGFNVSVEEVFAAAQ